MLVNAALELAPYDPEFQKLVCKELVFIEAFFRRCIEAGRKDGSIEDTRPADELAKLLLSVLLGIRVLARTRPQREVLEGAANAPLTASRSGRDRSGPTIHGLRDGFGVAGFVFGHDAEYSATARLSCQQLRRAPVPLGLGEYDRQLAGAHLCGDPGYGRIASTDKSRCLANARAGPERGPHSSLPFRSAGQKPSRSWCPSRALCAGLQPAGSVLPEILEPIGGEFGVPDRVLNDLVTEVMLQ
jgi:hypothetical protein